jgi:predicted  nucleic acid-binding Zn-ribbon protein
MLTPEGDTAPEIHRRQQAKIEELERDNRRLAKEASEGERRWKRAEEELEELREAEDEKASKGDTKTSALPSDEVQQLVSTPIPSSARPTYVKSMPTEALQKSQIAALERQNSHLQAAASRPSRHGASPSISHVHVSPPSDLSAELASKSSTIESMELEISNLRAQLQRVASGSSVEKEQIAALEAKLGRTEKTLETAQHELGDVKRNLERTTEKAVREGSSRTSAETKVRALERQVEEAARENGELRGKVEGLEKKVAAMTTLHREQDARSQALKKEREKADKESAEVRARVAGIENENLRLKEELERIRKRNAQGVDDDGVDELESEARIGLEKKIRELEGEIFDLKRGVWREGRKGLEPGAASPGQQFTDIDLGASPGHRKRASSGTRGGFGEIINYGIHALTGGGGEHEELLEDEDDEFDEEAWRRAQEEEGRRQIERVKEIKRGLDRWRGWRMDLVEVRKGGGDRLGEVFEV